MATTRVIRSCIRPTDTPICYGGDEFLLLLPGIPAEYLETKLEKIRRSVEEAVIPGYAHLRPSISIGGVMQTITDSIERAVRQADRMMYQAKNRKNTVAVAGPDRENVKNGTQEAPQQARQQILIIDDSEMNRAILAAILRQRRPSMRPGRPAKHGGPRKDAQPRDIVAEQAYEISGLKMENELLRDFMRSMERK